MSEAAKIGSTYEYIKYMPNGSTEKRIGVVRSRSANRKYSKTTGRKNANRSAD